MNCYWNQYYFPIVTTCYFLSSTHIYLALKFSCHSLGGCSFSKKFLFLNLISSELVNMYLRWYFKCSVTTSLEFPLAYPRSYNIKQHSNHRECCKKLSFPGYQSISQIVWLILTICLGWTKKGKDTRWRLLAM